MGIFFSGKELLDIAIRIEKNGAAFYDSLARSTGNFKIKGAYKQLADKEREHIEVFRNMFSSARDSQTPHTYSEEYGAYLKALIDSAVFTDDQVTRDMARKVSSDAEAIQIGLGAEKDSILFYSEMRELVRAADRDVVNKVIEQEKSHMRELASLKSSLIRH